MPRPVAISGPASGTTRPRPQISRSDIRSSDARSSKGALLLFFAVYAATLGLLVAPDGFFIAEPASLSQD